MKLLTDMLPVALFFIAFKLGGIYIATIVAIAATVAQIAYTRITTKKIEQMHVITLVMVILLGGATLLLQDEFYIKIKVSVVNWLFTAILIGSHFIGKQPVMERLMGKQVKLPREIWLKLNAGWAGFFALVGFVNLYIIYNYDTDTWVNFKLFGVLGMTLAFIVIQSLMLAKYIKK